MCVVDVDVVLPEHVCVEGFGDERVDGASVVSCVDAVGVELVGPFFEVVVVDILLCHRHGGGSAGEWRRGVGRSVGLRFLVSV